MKLKTYLTRLIVMNIIAILAYVIILLLKFEIVRQSSVRVTNILCFIVISTILICSIAIVIIAVMTIKEKIMCVINEKLARIEIAKKQSDPQSKLIFEIQKYLTNNVSTTYFRTILSNISEQMQQFIKHRIGIRQVIETRFDINTLTSDRFLAPLNNLLLHITKLGDDLVNKLYLFDEDRCQIKIDKLKRSGKISEVEELESVMKQYMEYAKMVEDAFEKTDVALDKLVLELSKLSIDELKLSIMALEELDDVIVNTKLYR